MWWAVPLAVALAALLYLYKINASMRSVPAEIAQLSPHRWAKEEIRETYERLKKQPLGFDKLLPPRLNRRYVVVGGSGLVGGDIVLALLARGQPAESIRIVDFAPPQRPDMAATGCDYVKADISDRSSVEAAFAKPWPTSVATLPLTVFHTAAVIRPQERSILFYERCSRVNRDGAKNVMEAAQQAGADIFVATSSASVALVPPNFWVWPWEKGPKDYFQVIDERDWGKPLREHGRFFGNYAYTKAEAERLILASNTPAFRTGTIRPGNPIYGQPSDPVVGIVLRSGTNVSWTPHIIQNFVCSRNVAQAHLAFEAALARKEMPACAGKPFVVTDHGPPTAYGDVYLAAMTLAKTPTTVKPVPPILLFLLAHMIEGWCLLLAKVPWLSKTLGWKEPSGDVHLLQPSVFSVSSHAFVDDREARKSVEEGGIGYGSGCATIEGVCEQVLRWNREMVGEE